MTSSIRPWFGILVLPLLIACSARAGEVTPELLTQKFVEVSLGANKPIEKWTEPLYV